MNLFRVVKQRVYNIDIYLYLIFKRVELYVGLRLLMFEILVVLRKL